MPLDYVHVRGRAFPTVEHPWTEAQSILYALAVGYGFEPTDRRQLPYVYEDGLVAAPTLPVVLAYPGFWMREPDSGIDWRRVLHASQRIVLHDEVPPGGTFIGEQQVTKIVDKGADVGAFVHQRRTVADAASGNLIAILEQVTLCRGDGGFGGGDEPDPPPSPLPVRAPDAVCTLPTSGSSALLYRLCGDRNPLHVDPAVAADAGFERPILHGLCTFGFAAHAILRTLCDYRPSGVTAISARFTAPVFPGEPLRTEMWAEHERVRFRVVAALRDVVVLSAGEAEIQPEAGS
jgi:acyl dehydratase